MTRRGRRASLLVATLGALATGGTAGAQPLATAEITVDAAAAGVPLEKVWAFHGYDEVNYTTSEPGRELLRTLAEIDPSPPHIRSHFLLNSGDGTPALKWGSTNVYSEDASGNPVYSWALMDGILDALTASGSLPLVEIGFMPHDLAAPPADPYRNSSVYSLDGHAFNPPKDFTKWAALIGAFAAHVRDRYPDVEGSWQWELWNEPDLPYWMGSAEQYLALYDYTEAALHAELPGASLGGPAVAGAGSALLRQFLTHCASGVNALSGATGTRLDMVSFHAKGGVVMAGDHIQMNLGNQLRLHRLGFGAVAAVEPFRQTPIVISEADPDGCAACPVAMNPENAYRNSPAYGAYVVAMTKRTLELEQRMGVNLRGLVSWAFLFNDTPYFAGYRALASHGIHLPVLNAFKLLGQLAGARVPLSSSASLSLDEILARSVRAAPDLDGLATRDGQRVRVLLWNYHDDLLSVPPSPVHLTVTMPEGFPKRARLTHLRVDEAHGDAYTVWLAQGSPSAPDAAQIAALEQAMQPAPVEPARSVELLNGSVTLDFVLPRFGLSLITLEPADDSEAPGALGAAARSGCSCRFRDREARSAPAALLLLGTLLVLLARRRAQPKGGSNAQPV